MELSTNNIIAPMTAAVTQAIEATRTNLIGIEKFNKIYNEKELERTFRFNLWLKDFEDFIAVDFPNATDERRASMLLRHIDQNFVTAFRAETIANTEQNIYDNTLKTLRLVIFYYGP